MSVDEVNACFCVLRNIFVVTLKTWTSLWKAIFPKEVMNFYFRESASHIKKHFVSVISIILFQIIEQFKYFVIIY